MTDENSLNGKHVCWECSGLTEVRTVETVAGKAYVSQIRCHCGASGKFHFHQIEGEVPLFDMESKWKLAEYRTVGSVASGLYAGIKSNEELLTWCDGARFHLTGSERVEVFINTMSRGDRLTSGFGFVYLMSDLANQEVKVGGTRRLPWERWKEHPRGLIPILALPVFEWRNVEAEIHARLSADRTNREEYFTTKLPKAASAAMTAASISDRLITALDFSGIYEVNQ